MNTRRSLISSHMTKTLFFVVVSALTTSVIGMDEFDDSGRKISEEISIGRGLTFTVEDLGDCFGPLDLAALIDMHKRMAEKERAITNPRSKAQYRENVALLAQKIKEEQQKLEDAKKE